jgi:hypothetical protein
MRLREIHGHSFWHASDVKDLKEIKPYYSKLVKKRVVFSAIYPEVAVAMSGHWTDEDFSFGRSMRKGENREEVPYVMKELRPGAFDEFFDHTVYLYEIDGKGFHDDDRIQDFELISDKPTQVWEEHHIDDPLDYLKKSLMVSVVKLRKHQTF